MDKCFKWRIFWHVHVSSINFNKIAIFYILIQKVCHEYISKMHNKLWFNTSKLFPTQLCFINSSFCYIDTCRKHDAIQFRLILCKLCKSWIHVRFKLWLLTVNNLFLFLVGTPIVEPRVKTKENSHLSASQIRSVSPKCTECCHVKTSTTSTNRSGRGEPRPRPNSDPTQRRVVVPNNNPLNLSSSHSDSAVSSVLVTKSFVQFDISHSWGSVYREKKCPPPPPSVSGYM